MRANIEKVIASNKTIITNFSYLSILQVFGLVLPLITYPYLIRVLGAEVYGRVLFAQAIVMYFAILINFGFHISATKDVAENRGDINKLGEVVSSVYIIKSILWIVSFLIYVALIFTIPSFLEDKWLFLFSFGFSFIEFLFPQWYFQGIEKMRYITIINISTRLLFTCLIFVFIKNREDYLLVPIFNTVGFLLGGLISLYVLVKFEGIKFRMQGINILKYYFLESFPLFLSAASIQIYVNANRVIVGAFLGMKDVAYYDLGEKVLKLLKVPVGMLGQAAFPKLSREKNVKLINRFLFIGISGTGVFIIVALLFRETIVSLLIGEYMIEAAQVLSILSISALMVAASQFLGTSRMIVFGYRKAFSRIIASSALFFLIVFGLLYMVEGITLMSLAWLAVSVEAWVTLLMFIFCYRKKLLI